METPEGNRIGNDKNSPDVILNGKVKNRSFNEKWSNAQLKENNKNSNNSYSKIKFERTLSVTTMPDVVSMSKNLSLTSRFIESDINDSHNALLKENIRKNKVAGRPNATNDLQSSMPPFFTVNSVNVCLTSENVKILFKN